MNKGRITYFAFMAILLLIASCSTTKVIPDGSYRLKENILEVTNSDQYPQYKDSELKNYIRQKPNTYFIGQWNPFLYIYNWSNGKNNGWDIACTATSCASEASMKAILSAFLAAVFYAINIPASRVLLQTKGSATV